MAGYSRPNKKMTLSKEIKTVDKQADNSEAIYKKFTNLASEWTQAVEGMSSTVEMTKHPSYQEIINMGQAVIPFLLEDLHQNPLYWLPALRQITQENPVLPEQRGKIKQMAEAWLNWGRQKGYII